MNDDLSVPYCGPAPLPETLLMRWNFDPLVLAGLFALCGAWWLSGRRDGKGRLAFYGGLALLVLAFISPLCALASALFSARVAHHLVLIAGVAPLLAIALPSRSAPHLPLGALVVLHAVAVWVWHAPGPYAFALSGDAAYWLMQLTLLASGWLMWSGILAPATRTGPMLMALLATLMQMGFLGALLVFASRPLYAAHWTTTAPFRLSALADQQLAGLLMWVPATLPYLLVALARMFELLGQEEAEPAR